MVTTDYNAIKRLAMENRLDVLDMIYKKNTGHFGGSMSSMDIMTTLYALVLKIGRAHV